MDIKNTAALVTGSNRGIGKAIVEAFISAGVGKVYVAARSASSVEPLIEQYGDAVVPVVIDLNQPETIAAAVELASDVEIVVNNAGILKTATALDDFAVDTLQSEMEVNVYGLIRIAQAFAPVLKANGGGALVQLNSVASLKNFSDFATYAASKAASYSITQGLRDKLLDQGTLVVSVHPGPIATDMANDAGLGEIAEPPSLVADSIVEALEKDAFHAFPDTMAKQFWSAYSSYAKAFIEAPTDEA